MTAHRHTPHHRFHALLASLAPVVVIAAACGGSDGLSHAQLVDQGNAICTDVNRGFEQIFSTPESRDETQSPQAIQRLLQQMLPVYQDAHDRFHDLEPSDRDDAAYGRFLDELDTWVGDLEVAGADPAQASALFAGEGPAPAHRLAAEAGIDGCEPKD